MAYCTENDLLNQLTQEKRTRSPHAGSRVLVGRGFNPAKNELARSRTTEGVRGNPSSGFPEINADPITMTHLPHGA